MYFTVSDIFSIFVYMTNFTMDTMARKIHHGANVKRFREFSGIKQEALADKLGSDWNQQKISLLEGKEVIEPEILKQVAKALGISPEVIKNFDESVAPNFINTFYDQSAFNYQCTFNPIEKLIEVLEKSNKEKYELLEMLLKERQEKK